MKKLTPQRSKALVLSLGLLSGIPKRYRPKTKKARKPVKFQDTGIEQKIEQFLFENRISYRKQENIMNLLNVDFYLPDFNVIIEADGCYWHGCKIHHPEKYRAAGKDHMRTQTMRGAGYTVLRLWEHDINGRFDWCAKQILKACN